MKNFFHNKSIIIIGATGGLGSAFSKSFAARGARLLLAGRNEQKLMNIKQTISGDITVSSVDVTDEHSVEGLADFAAQWSEKIDIIVNASGCDVRKSLDEHSFQDIRSSLDINLLGSVLITKALLPIMRNEKGSTIIHIGGFADGRLAFPYYSVDSASRAGLFSFVESMNRELELECSNVRIGYFCPSPADTEAERPFNPLWKNMGINIVPVDKVADALLKSIQKGKTVSIMGGFSTVLFAKLNSIFPKFADAIMMKRYGKKLREFLYGHQIQDLAVKKSSILNKIAIILVILSFIFYGLIALVPFLPISFSKKAFIVPLLVACGEITWWTGIAIVGKQVVTKYRKYINPCYWLSKNKIMK